MDNDCSKLRAPKPIMKAKSFNRGSQSRSAVIPKVNAPLTVSEFEFQPFASEKVFQFPSVKAKQNKIDFDNLEGELQKDFEELSIKSEIFGILSNNKFDIRNSNSSHSTTGFSAKITDDLSQELNLEEER